jgi:hypothetical protein
MNLKALLFAIVISLISGYGAYYFYRSLQKYRAKIRKIKKEGQFIYSKRGSKSAQVYPLNEKIENEKPLTYQDNKSIIYIDSFISYFAHSIGIILCVAITVAMFFWTQKVVFA